MRKIAISALIAVLIFAGFQACKPKGKPVVAKTDIAWAGMYKGTIPAADCEGIEITVILNADCTYTLHEYYIGKENNIDPTAGTFVWDKTGNIIELTSSANEKFYFEVGENKLTKLDRDSKPITGEHADMYVFKKIEIDANAHTSKNSLDWQGAYTGTIPCADCQGIEVKMVLNVDETYQVSYTYLGKKGVPAIFTGTFMWNSDGNSITLDSKDIPPHYCVGENQLTQLDMDGKVITGDLADKYILKKGE